LIALFQRLSRIIELERPFATGASSAGALWSILLELEQEYDEEVFYMVWYMGN